jgi:tetratricopeptide (TPR) repeat protein
MIWRRWIPVLVVVAGVVAYHNSFMGQFILDDGAHIHNNPRILQFWPPWAALSGTSRPLVQWSLALNHATGQFNPFDYHLFNLIVHLLAALALYGVVRRTLLRVLDDKRPETEAAVLAGLVALIWVVHPLNTQAVTYIIQRGESMMGLFYLLTLYCFIRGVEVSEGLTTDVCGSGRCRRVFWYVAALAACALGMATKPIMATAPLMVFLYDRVLIAHNWRRAWHQRQWFYVMLAATWLALPALLYWGKSDWHGSAGLGMESVSPINYAFTQPGVILHYLRLVVWPVDLCFDYLWPAAKGGWQIGPPLMVIVGLVLLTLSLVRRSHAMAFLGLWFFGVLSVTSSIMPIMDLAVEHRMYLSSAAVICAVVILVDQGRRMVVVRHPRFLGVSKAVYLVAVVLVVTALVRLTIGRNADYHDAIGMWHKVIAQRVLHPRGYGQIGQIHSLGMNKHREAIPYFEKVIALAPSLSSGYSSLGGAWSNLGDHEKALMYYQKASSLETNSALHVTNIGAQHAALGRWEDAVRFYEKALEMQPDYALAHNNMGVAFNRQENFDAALHHFALAVEHDPHEASYRIDLGGTLRKSNRPEAAIEQYRAALKIEPGRNQTRVDLGLALFEAGKTKLAIDQFQAALERDPSRVDICVFMAWTLATNHDASLRDGPRAVELGRRAVALTEGRSIAALDALGAALARTGNFDEAVALAESALKLAQQSGQQKLTAEIGHRLETYRSGKPFHGEPHTGIAGSPEPPK